MIRYFFAMILVSSVAMAHNHSEHEHAQQTAKPSKVTISESDKKSLLEVLKSNDGLFNDFLKDDQKKVEEAARLLEEKLEKITSSELESLKKARIALSKITKGKSKSENLEFYSEFVPSLVESVKNHASDSDYKIYYCPMVKKYWVQNEKTNSSVRNVFAQEMLECGSKQS